ncbi:MAG: acetate--CoA ligase family protein [Comamonadaceae bacterium]|nr:acetate--CoA ligase family protein [Comamonadaceae bacterium]
MAIIGASDDEGKWSGRFMGYLRKHGVPEALAVYPINPRSDSILGMKAYKRVLDCPGPVDMAVLLLPRDKSAAALQDCAEKGVHSIIAITAGYAETGDEGRLAQEAMVAQAHAAGTRVIGPNCMGLLNTHHQLVATTGMVMGSIDVLPKGPIGIASQSGALMGVMLARGVEIGAGFSSTVSVGNQGDLDVNDFLGYLIDDPLTRVVCLYIEEVRDPARFGRLLAKAKACAKPVLIVKAGRTSAGAVAVSSHTASMAGPYGIFEAVCRSAGAYLFETPFDMLQAAMLLSRGSVMTNANVAVFSGSGGGNALLVDQMEGSGMTLASLSPGTRDLLVPHLGQIGAVLPVDTASLSAVPIGDNPMEKVIDAVMQDSNVGAGVFLMTTQPNMEQVAKAVEAVGTRTSKPLVFVHAASNVGQAARELMKSARYGFVESPHDAIALLKALNDTRRFPLSTQPTASTAAGVKLPGGYLNEPAARTLLESHGIPTSRWQVAATREQCLSACRDLGFPLVAKAVSTVVVHKSDHGLVKVRLADEGAVLAAFDELQAAMQGLEAPFEGVLLTEMVDVDFELIAGIKVDPGFGPMLLVGSGGVLVEVFKDTKLAQAPVTHAQAMALITDLKCLPLLQGYRGKAAADVEELCSLLVKLSELAWTYKDQLEELDINPLALSRGRLVALDARALAHSS